MNLNQAEMMAKDLMSYYGLLNKGWKFKFDRALTRLGLCSFRKRIISLGKYATEVNSADEVLNTILHEIAHVLVGAHIGHGLEWKQAAKDIGCDGERLGHIIVKAPYKYIVHCSDCGKSIKSYRKPSKSLMHRCIEAIKRYRNNKEFLTNLIVSTIA